MSKNTLARATSLIMPIMPTESDMYIYIILGGGGSKEMWNNLINFECLIYIYDCQLFKFKKKNLSVFQLSQEDDVRNALKLTKEKFGRLDVTINCPYFAKSSRLMINVKDVPEANTNLSGEMMDLLFKVNWLRLNCFI